MGRVNHTQVGHFENEPISITEPPELAPRVRMKLEQGIATIFLGGIGALVVFAPALWSL